jgi:hypothetical protein
MGSLGEQHGVRPHCDLVARLAHAKSFHDASNAIHDATDVKQRATEAEVDGRSCLQREIANTKLYSVRESTEPSSQTETISLRDRDLLVPDKTAAQARQAIQVPALAVATGVSTWDPGLFQPA